MQNTSIDPRARFAQRRSPINPVHEPDARERADVNIREAAHTLEQYLKEMAAGATSGAAVGAIAGAPVGGVGALPGAGAGAVGGALLGAGTLGVQDLWDAFQPDYNKASARAGTIQERLDNVAGFLGGGQLSQLLQLVGSHYKDFIDAHVQQRQGLDMSHNLFQNEVNRSMRPAAVRGKFTRVAFTPSSNIDPSTGLPWQPGAYRMAPPGTTAPVPTDPTATDTTPASTTTAPPATTVPDHYNNLDFGDAGAPNERNPITEEYAPGLASNIGAMPLEEAGRNTYMKQMGIRAPHAASGAGLWETLGKEGLSALKNPEMWKNVGMGAATGVASLGAGFAADFATRAIWDTSKNLLVGVQPQIDGAVNDIKGLITEINGYAKNDPATVEAGNQLWRTLADLQTQIAQAAHGDQPVAAAPSTTPATAPTTDSTPAPGSLQPQSSTRVKFVRRSHNGNAA